MGPARASDILRECLYMGADEVLLISDRKFAGADTLATSYVLSEAIKKVGDFDFIFAGRQAIDGDTAQGRSSKRRKKLTFLKLLTLKKLLNFQAKQLK